MLVIEGRAYREGRIEPAAIGVEDGKIVAIKRQLRGDPVYRYSDALLLPGGVDVHVHLREPGMTHKDDLASGTESAAIGGVTTVVDMPNTVPPVATPDALRDKTRLAARSANVDIGLYAAPPNPEAVEALTGATAFKVYLAQTTNAPVVPDIETAGAILRAVKGTGTYLSAHCEQLPRGKATWRIEESATRPGTFDLGGMSEGTAGSLEEYHRERDTQAEVSAIRQLGRHRGDSRLHIAHVTTEEAVAARPVGATCEVTPHHLLFDTTSSLGALLKVNPPVRPPAYRHALWDRLVEGRIDMFASDHAPHTLEEKSQRFEDVPAGVPGVATTFPVLFRYVRRDILPLERFVAMFSENPSKLLGVNKGTIAVGRDADLLVVDPRRIEKVTAKRCRYKCGWTPFEGAEGTFPTATFVRGELVAQEGELVAERVGRMITRGEP